jgi:CheY-like chemotaxis protein
MTQRVLVAEDDEGVRSFLELLLMGAGYEVDVAVDGRETLEKLGRGPHDLLLLDLMMPHVDGWGVLQGLKGRSDAPPVIVVTGNGRFSEHRPLPEGVYATVTKPFGVVKLLQLCGSALAR